MSSELQRVRRLAVAIAGAKTRFECAGSFLPKKPVTLRFPKSREKVTFAGKPVLAPLLDRCVKAAFGKGEQTLRDVTVRDALQLQAPKFTVENFDPAKSGVLDEVCRVLCPGAPGSLTAKLYDVNVYERGGRFVGHKDTPAAPDMIGTLVVCLPSQFTGGALALKHSDEERTLDLGALLAAQDEPARVHWVAFFGDVDHAVRPVTAGTRVTLSYRLLVKPGTDVRGNQNFLEQLKHELQGALADAELLPLGGTLAFPCFHLYGHKSFPSAGRLDSAGIARLKGRDRLLATVARTLKLPVEIRPYLIEREFADTWELERFPTEKDVRNAPKPHTYEQPDDLMGVTLEDLEEAFPAVAHSGSGDLGVVWVIDRPFVGKTKYRIERETDGEWDPDEADDEAEDDAPEEELDGDDEEEDEEVEDEDEEADEEDEDEAEPPPGPPAKNEGLGPNRPALGYLFTADFSTTGYFGNEGGEGNFYVFAALAVQVPDLAGRGLKRTPAAIRAAALKAAAAKKKR